MNSFGTCLLGVSFKYLMTVSNAGTTTLSPTSDISTSSSNDNRFDETNESSLKTLPTSAIAGNCSLY